MESFIQYLANNIIAALVFAVLVLFFLYFVFKKFLKLVLFVGIIIIIFVGFCYYKAPEDFPGNLRSSINKIQEKSDNAMETGKEFWKKGETITKKIGDIFSDEEKNANNSD